MIGNNWPPHVTYEVLTDCFMKLCSDRYFAAAKVKEMANSLVRGTPVSIEDRYKVLTFKIIVLNSFRDAVRKVSLSRIFKTPQRRDELYSAIIETLEDFEDEIEQVEDQMFREE